MFLQCVVMYLKVKKKNKERIEPIFTRAVNDSKARKRMCTKKAKNRG